MIAPDVGGGFGPKNPFYPEELAVPAAALLLGRPIKWIEDRRESFTATNHEREQDWEVEAAVDRRRQAPRDSRASASRSRRLYPVRAFASAECRHQSHRALCACRPISSKSRCCLTNLAAATSTRGAGRPQGTFVMERLLDRIADELGLARDEVRRRNLIPPQQMPYVTPVHAHATACP